MTPNTQMIITSAITSVATAMVIFAGIFIWENWYRLDVVGYAWDTLTIRCEEERKGVLIGENCVKKDAIIWSAKDAPK